MVLNVIYETMNYFCKSFFALINNFISIFVNRKSISKKSVLDNYENLILLIDEIVDEGLIF